MGQKDPGLARLCLNRRLPN